jgi:hypothetical protein
VEQEEVRGERVEFREGWGQGEWGGGGDAGRSVFEKGSRSPPFRIRLSSHFCTNFALG